MSGTWLSAPWLGTPLWLWALFGTVVLVLLALDLGVLNKGDREIGVRRSLLLSAGYVSVSLLFAAGLWVWLGAAPATEFLTGFLVEKSLSLDNVFVIALIFSTLGIPRHYQHRVLFWGIFGVIVLRALMIGLGAALIHQFSGILYVFGAFLVFTGVRMWQTADQSPDLANNRLLKWLRAHLRITPHLQGHNFIVRQPDPATGQSQVWFTPLFVALCMVELMDLVFAVDSVPAIFAITDDPFIVYTSNIFAILGLRALYFALAAMIHRFAYLKYALALILVFIGSKIFLVGWVGKIPASLSLCVTLGLLAGGVLLSLWKTRTHTAVSTASEVSPQ
jgi:tellurite resistance protein TerC